MDIQKDDLSFIIEEHRKEIWEWKQKESEWIKTDNQLKGAKQIINELSAQIQELQKQLAELKK